MERERERERKKARKIEGEGQGIEGTANKKRIGGKERKEKTKAREKRVERSKEKAHGRSIDKCICAMSVN